MSLENFNPNNETNFEDGIFGIPATLDESKIVIQPVPWEVTTSYGGGTSLGPQAILQASSQLDLFDLDCKASYRNGYFLLEEDSEIKDCNDELNALIFDATDLKKIVDQVNEKSEPIHQKIFERARQAIQARKIPAVLGGDHSTPWGNIKAVSESTSGNFSILHLDAHHDLRPAYQGFQHSHASIMYNVMTSDWAPQKLVQVGIRDFSEEEHQIMLRDERINCFYGESIQEELFNGRSWSEICAQVCEGLSANVYISCDIDGLSPDFCPSTGTPVPGGLSFSQFNFLLKTLAGKNKRIIGFDLVEVAPKNPKDLESDEWDANVGARVLYKLCGWTSVSNGRLING